jgi:ribosome-binding factor A
MSRRSEQLGSTLKSAIQEVLQRGLQDPRVSGLITVTAVRVTEDLKTALVSISVLPESKQELTMHGLRAAAKHVRHHVGELVDARQMPEIIFKLDQTLKKQAAVMDAISKAVADTERRSHPGAASGPQTDLPADGGAGEAQDPRA